MATRLSKNLKLKINSNLTSEAIYNLERLDLLGGTFVPDSTNSVVVRSQEGIRFEPNSQDLGGDGVGGEVAFGAPGQQLSSMQFYSDEVSFSGPITLIDQAPLATSKLLLSYNTEVNGALDTTDRTLTFDVDGEDREVLLGGSFYLLGGDLSLTLSADTNLTLPSSGTLATTSGPETFINKTISATINTISGLTNTSIAAGAGILYSKLNLTGGILNADINSAAAISGSKINPNFGAQTVVSNGLELLSNGFKSTLQGHSALSQDIIFKLPNISGSAGQILSSDGSNQLGWSNAGAGSVTSVSLSAPGEFGVSGSPITTTGTLTLTKANQAANQVWAGPLSGPSAQPAFRSLTVADLPASLVASETQTWITSDGTTKVVTHGLGTTNLDISIIDLADNSVIQVSSEVVSSSSQVILTSSEAPNASGWKIILIGR